MIEIGGFWAYYSLWFLKDAPERRAIVIEPDPAHLDIGRQNAALNHCMIEFVQGFVGGEGPEISPFATEVSGTIELPRIDVTTLLAKRNIAYLDILHCDAQGAEFDVLLSCAELLAARRIGFIVVSTHIFPGLADPLLHQRCLWLVKELGGEVLAEHDVHESFSADGLIVAYFGAGKIDWKPPAISYNRYSSSFFRNPLYDLSLMRAALATSEQDRAARLEVIQRLDAEVQALRSRLEISEQDRVARLDGINRLKAEVGSLQAQLATSEEDRTARLDVIERLDAETQALRSQLEISEQDRVARLDGINRLKAEVGSLQAQLATSEEDRTAWLDVIERLDAEVQALRSRLEISEQDRAARREVIQCLDANLQLLQAELEARKHPWKTWARSSARTLKRAVLKHSRKQD